MKKYISIIIILLLIFSCSESRKSMIINNSNKKYILHIVSYDLLNGINEFYKMSGLNLQTANFYKVSDIFNSYVSWSKIESNNLVYYGSNLYFTIYPNSAICLGEYYNGSINIDRIIYFELIDMQSNTIIKCMQFTDDSYNIFKKQNGNIHYYEIK